MMKIFTLIFSIALLACTESPLHAGKHLFILSGQSNMGGLKPEESFIPTVEMEFGKENVIVIKDAMGGQPIRRWYKAWKDAEGKAPESTGDLYERLMKKVQEAAKGQEIETVSFFWMQGERDAREGHSAVYKQSLEGLVQQLRDDLGEKDIVFINGRLSDFGTKKQKGPSRDHWLRIREVQVELAKSNPLYDWVDTDDLNDGVNRRGKEIQDDLHYSAEGYKIFGQRFAEKAIAIIKQQHE